MIRIIVADDEQVARQRLKRQLMRIPDVSVIAEAADTATTAALLRDQRPDVLFLDIEMADATRLELGQTVGGTAPLVVFLTSFDEHVIRAFEIHGADYLLKPFTHESLASMWSRLRERLRVPADRSANFRAVVEELGKERTVTHRERILVASGGRTIILMAHDVEWVEAAANYVKLHIGTATYMLRESMQNFERQLDPMHFMRVHRSAIVNVDQIREIQPWFSGDQIVVLKSGARVKLSRTYRRSYEARFGARDPTQRFAMSDV